MRKRYEYDEADIAKSLIKAMQTGAPKDEVRYYLDRRNEKIASSPAYAGYANDSVTRQAREYLRAEPETLYPEVDRLYDARRQRAADALQRAFDSNEADYHAGVDSMRRNYDDARAAYAHENLLASRASEEALAAQGLSRGAYQAPSSGYGETARLALALDSQNALQSLDADEREASDALSRDFRNKNAQALDTYADVLDNLESEQAAAIFAQRNADRDYGLKTDTLDTQNSQWEREFAYQKQQDAANQAYQADRDRRELAYQLFVDTGEVLTEAQAEALGIPVGTRTADFKQAVLEAELARRQFESETQEQRFRQAYDLFASAGSVLNEQMAQILGIPVGTPYWQYVIDLRQADLDSARAQTDALRAQSDALRAQASYLTAQKR